MKPNEIDVRTRVESKSERKFVKTEPQSMYSNELSRPEERLPYVRKTEWFIDELIPQNQLTLICGKPGGFKSLIIADLVVCATSGKKWLGKSEESDTGGFDLSKEKVLWIDNDQSLRRTSDRIIKFENGHEKKMCDISILSNPSIGFDANSKKHIIELEKLIFEDNFTLVILDTLINASNGVDENSSQINRVMSNLYDLKERTKINLIVVHHVNKANEEFRGHSSILAKADYLIYLTKKNNIFVEFKMGKARDRVKKYSFVARLEEKDFSPEEIPSINATSKIEYSIKQERLRFLYSEEKISEEPTEKKKKFIQPSEIQNFIKMNSGRFEGKTPLISILKDAFHATKQAAHDALNEAISQRLVQETKDRRTQIYTVNN